MKKQLEKIIISSVATMLLVTGAVADSDGNLFCEAIHISIPSVYESMTDYYQIIDGTTCEMHSHEELKALSRNEYCGHLVDLNGNFHTHYASVIQKAKKGAIKDNAALEKLILDELGSEAEIDSKTKWIIKHGKTGKIDE